MRRSRTHSALADVVPDSLDGQPSLSYLLLLSRQDDMAEDDDLPLEEDSAAPEAEHEQANGAPATAL